MAWRAGGGSRIPEAWIKELYTSKNRPDQNQNLPMMENKNTAMRDRRGLPLAGARGIKNLLRKEPLPSL